MPIVVVSGLPRSGTSMTMRMLEAGGLGIVSDGVRAADDSNPRGYYELDRVKTLDRGSDTSWLADARGKAIKIVSFFLRDLPVTNNYQVIFMHRRMNEVLASQRKMLERAGNAEDAVSDESMTSAYERHLDTVKELLKRRSCFEVLDLGFEDVLANPVEHSERIVAFLGLVLDVSRMAAAVDPALYRNKSSSVTRHGPHSGPRGGEFPSA